MALNNDNNDKSCKCTAPEYELILNEQGPQGRQGEKGDAGFTPIISVKDNTPSNYTLNILTQDGQITTPNLKANLPAGGATGQVLTKNSGEQDDCSWQNLPASTIETEGIARLATEADFETTNDTEASDNTIVTPALFNSELEKQSAKFVTTDTQQNIDASKTFWNGLGVYNNLTIPYNSHSQNGKIVTNATVDNVRIPIVEPYDTNGSFRIGAVKEEASTNIQNGFDINNNTLDGLQGVTYYEQGQKGKIIADFNIDKYVKAGDNVTIDKGADGSLTINSTSGGITDAYTKAETDNLLDTKQDKLVATTGIEINNNNIGINQKGTSLIEYNNTNRSIGYIEDDVLHQEQNVIEYIKGIAAPIIDIPDNSIHSFDISTVVKLSEYNDNEDNRILEIGGNGTNAAFFDTHAYHIKNMVRMVYSVNGVTNAYWHETIQDDKYLAVRLTNDGTTLKFFTKIVDTPELPTDWNEWENIPWDLSLYPIEKGDILPAIINIGGEVNKNPANDIISTLNIQKGLYYLTQTKIIINDTLFSYTSSNYNDAIATTENYGLVKIDGDSLTINENYQLQANIPSNLTTQGNTFNGASQLVQLDSSGKLPAIDGSQLTNLPSSTPTNMVTTNTIQDITAIKTFVGTSPLRLRNTSIGKIATPFRLLQNSVFGNKILIGDCPDEGMSISGLPVAIAVPASDKTIYKVANNDLSTFVPVLDKENFSSVAPTGNLKYWTGTEEAYTAIGTKDADTLYRTTDTNKVYLGTIQIGGQ